MYIIPPAHDGVTLHNADGNRRYFVSRKAVFVHLGLSTIRHSVGPQLSPEFGWRHVILDANDKPLSIFDFEDCQTSIIKAFCRFDRFSSWNGLGPVPGTGRGRYGRYYRKIRTTAERRANVIMDIDEPAPRARRSGSSLPNSRDDFSRSNWNNKNWKRFRKHQWK